MSTISLTVPTNTVTISAGKASLTASVTNGSPVPARIVLGAFGPPGATAAATSALGWTRIDRPARDIAAGVTEQFAVTFVPEPGTAPGRYPVRFIAYSAEQAPEENADQAQPVEVIVPEAPPPPPPPPPRWWRYVAAAVALLVVVGVVAWLVRPSGDLVTVPDWHGKGRQTVQTEAQGLGLEVVFSERVRDPGSDAAPGTVIGQDPVAFSRVAPKSSVAVVLARGVTLPGWTGDNQFAVLTDAARLGLTNVSFTTRISDATPGTVIGQTPDPLSVVSPDDPITVVLARTRINPPTIRPSTFPTIVKGPIIELPNKALRPVGP